MPDDKKLRASDVAFDTDLARLVVEQRLATQAEVQHCLDLMAQIAEEGGERSTADIMVEQGVVTPNQIGRLKRQLDESGRAQEIPGYRVMEKLGSGAMAHVFKARQLSLDRLVAVKVLPRQLSESREYVERFYKEGKAAAKLNHPNIVQAIDVGEAGGFHYFVMEYVEGHTLHDELLAHKVFSETEALRVIIQVAKALEHAHRQGLIHRDVKPKNIMITKDGRVKLADMGLARVADDAQAAQKEAGRAFGTPYYISPEQIRGELDIDFRADIYSLGATLYHLVTGRVPFEGPSPQAVMMKHLKEPLIPPDHINTTLSAGLGEVVEVMMAKDRDHRYASTSDLLMDLESIQAGQPPLQARSRIKAAVLKGLTAEAEPSEEAQAALEDYGDQSALSRNSTAVVVILSAALAVSIMLNIFLLAKQ
ncbi:MAG: serine/threonine protein kinase [Phycisphaerae bacterium]|nr:serine/threonine protein kinase [Phycisphaerae bacterium]